MSRNKRNNHNNMHSATIKKRMKEFVTHGSGD